MGASGRCRIGGAEKIRQAFGKGRDWRLYGGGVSVPGTGIKDWHLHRRVAGLSIGRGKYEVRFDGKIEKRSAGKLPVPLCDSGRAVSERNAFRRSACDPKNSESSFWAGRPVSGI